MIICALSIGLFFSCENNRESVVTKFPQTISLEATPVSGMDKYPDILSVTTAADKFVCRSRGEYFYYVFDSNFKLESQVARKGHGNKEFLAPLFSGQYLQEQGKDYIYLLERPQRSLYKVNLHDERDVTSIIKLPIGQKIEPRYLFVVDDRFIGANDDKDCKVFVYDDLRKKCVVKEQTYANGKSHDRELYQSLATYNPISRKLAVSFFNLPQMDIRDADGDMLRTIYVDGKPQFKERLSDTQYFSCICSTDKYIYALYDGYAELERQGKCAVLVFDWQGNPIVKYIIDSSSYIAVDVKNKRILSVADTASGNRLLSYPI